MLRHREVFYFTRLKSSPGKVSVSVALIYATVIEPKSPCICNNPSFKTAENCKLRGWFMIGISDVSLTKKLSPLRVISKVSFALLTLTHLPIYELPTEFPHATNANTKANIISFLNILIVLPIILAAGQCGRISADILTAVQPESLYLLHFKSGFLKNNDNLYGRIGELLRNLQRTYIIFKQRKNNLNRYFEHSHPPIHTGGRVMPSKVLHSGELCPSH
jgi:hypothetical protein